MINTAEIFETKGCVRVDQLIDAATTKTISEYFENKIKRGEWGVHAEDQTTKFSYYADPLIEVLLVKCKDSIEQACGKELLPTYSYCRIYQAGEELKPHVDRPSCEISVTVNVANLGGISPIYMQYADNPEEEHFLNPGDAVVYKGCEVMHSRKLFKSGQLNVQFMLHYVDKNGVNAGYAMDNRPYYAAPFNSKNKEY